MTPMEPTAKEPPAKPDPDCHECGGEGIDGDPWGFFDYEIRVPCGSCGTVEATEKPAQRDEASPGTIATFTLPEGFPEVLTVLDVPTLELVEIEDANEIQLKLRGDVVRVWTYNAHASRHHAFSCAQAFRDGWSAAMRRVLER